MKTIIGYTTGVFDMFHVGHLNLLKRAKEQCDYLIVGVSTDEVVQSNKHKTPIIPFANRVAIVEAIRYVDKVVPQESYDVQCKIDNAVLYGVNRLFVGSDWQGTEKWKQIEKKLAAIGCEVIYLPYTEGVSSTLLRSKIIDG